MWMCLDSVSGHCFASSCVFWETKFNVSLCCFIIIMYGDWKKIWSLNLISSQLSLNCYLLCHSSYRLLEYLWCYFPYLYDHCDWGFLNVLLSVNIFCFSHTYIHTFDWHLIIASNKSKVDRYNINDNKAFTVLWDERHVGHVRRPEAVFDFGKLHRCQRSATNVIVNTDFKHRKC